MLFRPSFCANCGEKIERVEWGILTSRRFCQVCEVEFKGHDLIPRFVVGVGILAAIFGFGSYLQSGSSFSDASGSRRPIKLVEQKASGVQPLTKSQELASSENVNQSDPQKTVSAADVQIGAQAKPQVKPKTMLDEATYYCGAETKKGTPCSRSVKGNTRCFQHMGMPAMASAPRVDVK